MIMVLNVFNLESSLKKFKLSKDNISVVNNFIRKELNVYKKLELDISNLSLIFVGKKIEGIDVIRVFNKINVPIEILDTSYTRLMNLSSLEDWNTNFILYVSFLKDVNYVDIVKCKLKDISKIKSKKIKAITYGLTDGKEIIKIDILQQDIKGITYDVLREVVEYTFKKQTGKDASNIDCIALNFS